MHGQQLAGKARQGWKQGELGNDGQAGGNCAHHQLARRTNKTVLVARAHQKNQQQGSGWKHLQSRPVLQVRALLGAAGA